MRVLVLALGYLQSNKANQLSPLRINTKSLWIEVLLWILPSFVTVAKTSSWGWQRSHWQKRLASYGAPRAMGECHDGMCAAENSF